MIPALLVGAAVGALLTYALARVRGGRAPTFAREAASGAPDAPTAPESSAREELRKALESLVQALGARRALLWDVDTAHGFARASAVTSGEYPPEIGLQADPVAWALEHRIPLRLTTSQRWSRGGNGCAIPLRADGAGALVTLEFAVEADLPDPDTLALWGGYIDAFVRAEAYQARAARDRLARDELLNVLRRLTEAQDEATFATDLAEAVWRLAEVDGAAVALWKDGEGQLLALAGEAGTRSSGRFRLAESVLGLVPRMGGVVARERRREESRRLPILAPGERWAVEPRAAAAFPLRDEHDGIVAVVGIWSLGESTLDPRSMEAVDTIVEYAQLHLRKVVAYGAAKHESLRDSLTGLPNRRALEERLAGEAARCARYGGPLAVVMLDIDHFKAVNDTYGHDGGDAVLRALGPLLTSSLRETDVPARLGGEEFVVLLPETSLRAAADTAERLRASLERLEIPWRGGRIGVTASFGVSAAPECVPVAATLLESADAALYQAKEGGRNRVAVAMAAAR